jgi:hypothetical protein
MPNHQPTSAPLAAAERSLRSIRETIAAIRASGDLTALPRFEWAERDAAEGLRILETEGKANG